MTLLPRSALIRVAVLLPLAVALIAWVVLFETYSEARSAIRSAVQAAVEQEIEGLDQAFRSNGMRALVDTIDSRVQLPVDRAAVYLLTDPDGRALAGNLPSWPQTLAVRHGADFVLIGNGGERLDGKQFVLNGGLRLIVGRRSPEQQFARDFFKRVAVSALLMGLGCAAISLPVIVLYRRRVQRLSTRAQSILSGDLAQRLPVDGSNDELDALAQDFNHAFAHIEQLMAASKHLSSAIAHDLRRPLAAQLYRMEALANNAQTPAATRAELDALIDSARETLKMFASMLKLARIESGGYALELAHVDLKELLEDAVDTFAPVAAADGRELVASLAAAAVSGDRGLLFAVLQNLLENALRHGAGRIEVSLRNLNGQAQLRVRDHGEGVSPASLARIFERFYRADVARTEEGSGLGLALVKAIVVAHHGSVSARNVNPGLELDITLPLLV